MFKYITGIFRTIIQNDGSLSEVSLKDIENHVSHTHAHLKNFIFNEKSFAQWTFLILKYLLTSLKLVNTINSRLKGVFSCHYRKEFNKL